MELGPVASPVTEESPCLVEDSRKPFYATAKLAAERTALAYGRTRGLPVSIVRFWWSYGREIGGRHLRDMAATARAGGTLAVPAGAGGSFLDHEDLACALLLAARADEAVGEVFNLATLYVEWREIAQMILDATRSSSRLEVVAARDWKGARFLSDAWELSTAKAARRLGYRSAFSPQAARQRLSSAIALGVVGGSARQ